MLTRGQDAEGHALLTPVQLQRALRFFEGWSSPISLENVVDLLNAEDIRAVFDVSDPERALWLNHDALFQLLTGQLGIPVVSEARALVMELLNNLAGDSDANVYSLDQPLGVSDRVFWRLVNRLNFEMDRVGVREVEILSTHAHIFRGSDQNVAVLQKLLLRARFETPLVRSRFEAFLRDVARTVPPAPAFGKLWPAILSLSSAATRISAPAMTKRTLLPAAATMGA
jgi:hypothetical protein